MRTRNGNYPTPTDGITFSIRPPVQKRRGCSSDSSNRPLKSMKFSRSSPFDSIHDDLLVSIIISVSSTSSSPADLVNTMLTCKRFCAAATHPQVLSSSSVAALAVKASSWSDGACRFLKQCADAGNNEACYILGMIRFYCLQNRGGGASLMAKAAMASHAPALHSLAVIQFNGSGGTRKDKDLKAGVALCARAASLGHIDAMRELGHCLQDGYGVPQNIVKGRGLLLEANTREAAAAVAQSPRHFMETALQITSKSGPMACLHHHLHLYTLLGKTNPTVVKHVPVEKQEENNTADTRNDHTAVAPKERAAAPVTDCHPVYTLLQGGGCSLLSDFGCNVPPPKLHVANRFLVDWFGRTPPGDGLRLCSHANCGRPETRRHEFRRCSACGSVNYCSRACQALDWKIRHKYDCTPVEDWEDREENNDGEDDEEDQEHEHDEDHEEMEVS